MSLPSDSLSPAQLWSELTKLPRPHREVDFPRKDAEGNPICKLILTSLTPSEQVRSASEAEKYVQSKFGVQKTDERGTGYSTVYDSAAATEFLYQSARSSQDFNAKFFPSSQAIRDHLTSDEVAVLVQAYAQMTGEIGPMTSTMSESDMEAWLEKLALGAQITSPFYLLTSEQKNDLLKYSAQQLWSSRKVNASPGLPVEENTTEP
jgi:hypothetical protein